MKKAFIVIIPVLVIAGLVIKAEWGPSSPRTSTAHPVTKDSKEASFEAILKSDLEKITVHLEEEVLKGSEWNKINDYAMMPGQFVSKENAKKYFEVSKDSIPKIYSCLRKDFCGMQTRGEDDAYFDDERTPAHLLLNRNLRVMLESLRNSPDLKSEVDWELMEEIVATNNHLLTPEALEIMREFNSEAMSTEDLLKISRDSNGDTRANSLLAIAKNKGALNKTLVGQEVKDIFAGGDSHTAISVLENLVKMKLQTPQLPDILKNLCRFKAEEDHNWPMIKFEAKKVYTQFESLCN